MSPNRTKLMAIAIFLVPIIFLVTSQSEATGVVNTQADAAATYKAKCAMCHGPAVAKFFDPAKSDEDHVQAILKGRKGDKPPAMPAYEDKGIDEEAAKALVAHMRQLKAGS